jgi:hypothetical protein
MADLVFLTVLAAFFAVAALYIRACDRISTPEDDADR